AGLDDRAGQRDLTALEDLRRSRDGTERRVSCDREIHSVVQIEEPWMAGRRHDELEAAGTVQRRGGRDWCPPGADPVVESVAAVHVAGGDLRGGTVAAEHAEPTLRACSGVRR